MPDNGCLVILVSPCRSLDIESDNVHERHSRGRVLKNGKRKNPNSFSKNEIRRCDNGYLGLETIFDVSELFIPKMGYTGWFPKPFRLVGTERPSKIQI